VLPRPCAPSLRARRGCSSHPRHWRADEVIREALRDWKLKRELRLGQLAELKADIDRGLANVAEGRLAKFDAKRIIARGRKLLADRSTSASPKQQK
jgi:Arc/MetJ-type ribon-helix-helix transcriptional regulator